MESSDLDEDDKRKSRARKKRAGKKSSHDKTLDLLTKNIEELTAQRVQEPSRGEKWCINYRLKGSSMGKLRCEIETNASRGPRSQDGH